MFLETWSIFNSHFPFLLSVFLRRHTHKKKTHEQTKGVKKFGLKRNRPLYSISVFRWQACLFLPYPPLLLCSCVLLLPERRHLLLCHLPLTDMAPGRGGCLCVLSLSLRALRCVAHCPHSVTAISLGFGCLAAFLPLSVWTHCGVGEREGCPLHCTAPHPHLHCVCMFFLASRSACSMFEHTTLHAGGPAATLSRSLLFSWLQLHPPLPPFGNGGGATIFFSPLPSCDATLAAAAYRLLPF